MTRDGAGEPAHRLAEIGLEAFSHDISLLRMSVCRSYCCAYNTCEYNCCKCICCAICWARGFGARRFFRRGFQVSDRYDLSERLPYLINRVGAALVGFATPSLKRHHLTIPLWRVLAILAHKGEMRQVDLAGATSLDPPTVSRLISHAARRGMGDAHALRYQQPRSVGPDHEKRTGHGRADHSAHGRGRECGVRRACHAPSSRPCGPSCGGCTTTSPGTRTRACILQNRNKNAGAPRQKALSCLRPPRSATIAAESAR